MGKAVKSVKELVAMIERGDLRLPEMQRRYVWRGTRVRDLLDSLYRGYPSGTILIWETGEDVPIREFSVKQDKSPYSTTLLLLDGQQRLTSLSAVLRGEPVTVRWRKRPIEILFNLDHPDELSLVTEVQENGEAEDDDDEDMDDDDDNDASEDELQERLNQLTFVVSAKRLAQMPNWIPVTEVFKSDSDAPFLKKAGVKDFDDPRYKKYTQRLSQLRGIKNYEYNLHVLEQKLSYEEVTEIFVRVNSLGAKLRSSDLALAQITARWRNALSIFEEFEKECDTSGFDVDTGLLVKNLVVFATGQSRFNTVNRIPLETLQESWKHSMEGIRFALNFLRSNAQIDSPALLSSPFIVIALGYFGQKRKYSLTPKEAAELTYWLLVANAKGRYSRGSSETILDQDLKTIDDDKGVAGLIDALKLQMGRLEVTPEDLEGRNQRSGLFKTMFVVFRSDGATDWNSNLKISLSHQGKQHKLQFHHIFPKAILSGKYKPREINDIANLAFISGKTNRHISKNKPEAYIPKVIEKQGNGQFELQAIPTDSELLTIEAYMLFLAERRKRIAERINHFFDSIRKEQ